MSDNQYSHVRGRTAVQGSRCPSTLNCGRGSAFLFPTLVCANFVQFFYFFYLTSATARAWHPFSSVFPYRPLVGKQFCARTHALRTYVHYNILSCKSALFDKERSCSYRNRNSLVSCVKLTCSTPSVKHRLKPQHCVL